MNWVEVARRRLTELGSTARLRSVRDVDGIGPVVKVGEEEREVVSFASNDYLGLAVHPEVIKAALAATERWGTGAGSARLIVGSRSVHRELEDELAAWKSKERSLLFPTGSAANIGVLSVFGGRASLICSDELNHASIVDGCRLARAPVAVYPHKDMEALEKLLAGADSAVVVSDLVFSMDGDVAPVADLVEVCSRYGALLVIDEAHAVLGPYPGRVDVDRIRVGTLSKFLGSSGGFAAADGPLISLLENEARSFIFTTASPPAVAAAALEALRILRSAEGETLVQRLRSNVERLAPGHPSPIVPIIVGDETAAMSLAGRLLDAGFLVPAIRPPSVAPGLSRLRVTLSAAHTNEQIESLRGVLEEEGVAAGHV